MACACRDGHHAETGDFVDDFAALIALHMLPDAHDEKDAADPSRFLLPPS